MSDKQAKAKVLVVDDERNVLLTYRMLLEQEGCAATALATAQEAIESIKKTDFDLILCDLSLEAKRTGFEVIDAARAKNPNVPCVLLTGYASHDSANHAERQGVTVLYKPIEIGQFLSTIQALLKRSHDQAKAGKR